MVIALIMETDFKRLKTSHVTWKWLHMEMIVMVVLLEFLFPFPNLTFFFFKFKVLEKWNNSGICCGDPSTGSCRLRSEGKESSS